MKKSRLLEIIREEIGAVLSEVGQSPEETKATNLAIQAEKAKIAAAQKQLQQLQKTGVSEVALEEEQLDEMARITEPIRKGIEVAVDRLVKQKSDITPDEITRLIRNKKSQEKVAPELAAALEADADEKGGDAKYTFGIGYPQTLGAVQIAMGLKKAKGSEPKAEKPAKEKAPKNPTEKAPKAKAEPKTSNSDEAPAGDAEMEKAARGRDDLTIQYRGVMDTYKKMKAEEGDQAALEYLKTKQNIVKAYKKAQEVNI